MEEYTTHIKAKNGVFDVDFKELFRYRDLIYLFFKRNYTTRYKQTILGPLWLIINPLITVSLYALVFGNIADLASGEVPQFVFYLSSNALWTFFSLSITQTANTFTANAQIMGKVYFPRLVMPISSVLTAGLDLVVQLGMLFFVMIGYRLTGYSFDIGLNLMLAPILIIQVGLLGLGCGIIVAACTTKYRDLIILVGFGVQIWMYASPVVYSLERIPSRFSMFYMLANPMSPIMECWRNATIGTGVFQWSYWGASWIETLILLFIGVILFSRIEKTFMDTV